MYQTSEHYLSTPDGHQLHYACFGERANPALLFLHGGPGSACHAGDAQLFDPTRRYVIQTDQRGCGKSTPAGSLRHNTTQHLVADIERLRETLGLERWTVYGGSWGAALALEYAKHYPHTVERLILRGTFLARQQDLDWFVGLGGAALEFPTAYATLLQQLQVPGHSTLGTHLYQSLLAAEQDVETAYQAALAIGGWNSALMRVPAPSVETDTAARQRRIQRELIFSHYCQHGFFLPDEGVLAGIEVLRDIPLALVHGKHDRVCRLEGAETLCSLLPQAQLQVVEAGHGLHEAGIQAGLKGILRQLAA